MPRMSRNIITDNLENICDLSFLVNSCIYSSSLFGLKGVFVGFRTKQATQLSTVIIVLNFVNSKHLFTDSLLL